ncbi:hypothetical protein JW962_02135 [Candidatus Dojkabacteria bacterium]|nr:hypothetical protein [Candidatus Dojkabacteria bacterium]
MIIKKKAGQLILEKNGSQILVFPEGNVSKSDEKISAVISNDKTISDETFIISGSGEWEFSEIFIYGYKGTSKFYYLAIADNTNVLFVQDFLDLDLANKTIPFDIDMYVIPFNEEFLLSDRIKKDIGAIDTGNIVFYWPKGESPSDQSVQKLKDYIGVVEIKRENKFKLDNGIRDNKFFFVLE